MLDKYSAFTYGLCPNADCEEAKQPVVMTEYIFRGAFDITYGGARHASEKCKELL